MSRSAGPFGLMIGLLMMACGGCESTGLINPQQEPLPPGATYLLHLPGISGDTFFDRAWMTSLKEGGVADRVVLFDWTCRDPGIDALQAYARNRRQADQIAHLLSSQAESNPTGHLILTAESGGAALAVWALERLPRNVKVDQVVLVQPAISPGYDLSSALRHVKRNMYYTSSPGDWFVLGFGTRVFGTSDGQRTDAAGLVGFQAPGSADARQYRKLIELKYDPVWMQWGDFGGHTGGLSTGFAYHVLAPLLTAPQLLGLAHPMAATTCAARTLAARPGDESNPGIYRWNRFGLGVILCCLVPDRRAVDECEGDPVAFRQYHPDWGAMP